MSTEIVRVLNELYWQLLENNAPLSKCLMNGITKLEVEKRTSRIMVTGIKKRKIPALGGFIV